MIRRPRWWDLSRPRKLPDKQITEHRDEPTITERTLAALVSNIRTRIHIEREHDDPSVNGMYLAEPDQIFLFKCKGNIPAVSVALEEAGHSLFREEYITEKAYCLEVQAKLAQWHPVAPHLVDWYEDGRVYAQLKTDYPGAAHDLDLVWKRRRESMENKGVTRGPNATDADVIVAHAVLNEYMRSVTEYEAGRVFSSFHSILVYLDKLVKDKPKNYPPLPKDFILIVGKPGDFDGRGMKRLKMIDLETLFKQAGIHTIMVSMGGDGAGNDAIGSQYSWKILAVESVSADV